MILMRGWGYVVFLVFVIAIPGPATRADTNHLTIIFDRSKLIINRIGEYDRLSYDDLEPTRQPGCPQLPVKLIRFQVPPGLAVSGVTVTAARSEPIAGEYQVFPAQPPQVLSKSEYHFVSPRRDIYQSAQPFPVEPALALPGGFFIGQNIGALAVYPVQYIPASKQLVFFSEIEIQINYSPADRVPLPYRSTPYSDSVRRAALKRLVETPEPLIQKPERRADTETALPAGEHAYVIITDESLTGALKPLADWKYQKGLGATTVTTGWIYQNYTGPDNPAKVRAFIKDAYQNWGTVWVLLAGDTQLVPVRYAYAFDCEYGAPSDNNIPCDLYYSDLDGSWNANGNSVYGEVDDDIDMYPDVFVGRASVEDTLEAAAWVAKLLSYESSIQGSERDMLFLAAVLWTSPYTDSGLAKDHIDELYVPGRFDPITKLYAATGNETYTSAMNALNAGSNIINHCGHAYVQTLSVGQGYLMNYDMDALTNGPHYSILYTIGCWPAAFDQDCIAEHFIQNPHGGGVAFIGNSRYGWGSPGNPVYGYSDRFDQQFFRQLYDEDNYHIGRTLAEAKAGLVPFAGQENVYRWCEYEINLLGDPEMMIWTDDAAELAVDHPAELPGGLNHCPVTVTAGGDPVEGALVCVSQAGSVYKSAFTGLDGRAVFQFDSSNPTRPVVITVTAHNFIPHTDSIPLVAGGPCVQISNYTMAGSAEGFVPPGEYVPVEAYFTNFGSDTAFQVTATLRCSDLRVTLGDSLESIDSIPPGGFRQVHYAFDYTTDPGLVDGQTIQFNMVISDTSGHVWTSKLSAVGAVPILRFCEYAVTDEPLGDGDGLAEPGETIRLDMLVRNTGHRTANLIRASLASRHPDVEVIDSEVIYWSIPPAGYGQVPARLRIDPACPQPLFPKIDVVYETGDGRTFADSIVLAIGDVGFFDDMECGDGGWTHSGSYDYWHRSDYRQHSGSTSWYAGQESPRSYMNGASASLESPLIVLDRDSELSFWCWYKFPNYGVDGMYVDLFDGQEWVTLDFIGSGGALGRLPTGNTWLQYTYDLSEYPAGTPVAVRFHLVSDAEDVEEGVYVDDVTVGRRGSGDLIVFVPPVENSPPATRLQQNYPNPFNPVTTIGYSLERPERVAIVIFDVQGARVRTLLDGPAGAGPHTVVWDGRNDDDLDVSSGVYLYRMTAGAFRETRKMVLIR